MFYYWYYYFPFFCCCSAYNVIGAWHVDCSYTRMRWRKRGKVGKKPLFFSTSDFHIYRTTWTSNIWSIHFRAILLFVFRVSFAHEKPAILLLFAPNPLAFVVAVIKHERILCTVGFVMGERRGPRRFIALKISHRHQRNSISGSVKSKVFLIFSWSRNGLFS